MTAFIHNLKLLLSLVYLRARYYNPSTGRFISRDSVTGDINDPLSLNLYTYCHNNPLLNFDPSGHWIIKDWYMKNIYEPMDDFGGKVYDFDVEYMDNWYTGLDELKHSNNTAVKSFGAWCEYYNNFSNDLYKYVENRIKILWRSYFLFGVEYKGWNGNRW